MFGCVAKTWVILQLFVGFTVFLDCLFLGKLTDFRINLASTCLAKCNG